MTSKCLNRHPDIMHDSFLTYPCKTTFPWPGWVHRNSSQYASKSCVLLSDGQVFFLEDLSFSTYLLLGSVRNGLNNLEGQ